MKKWKKIVLGTLILAIAGAGYGWYLYNKKPADVRKLKPKEELTAQALVAAFNTDENAANLQYLDKVISVSGKVKEVKIEAAKQVTVFLDSEDPLASVTCSFYDDEAATIKDLQPGTEVSIKGRCTGKLMDVVLNKCSINK